MSLLSTPTHLYLYAMNPDSSRVGIIPVVDWQQ
jgi:hypothetical protein